jgi:cyanate permease
MAGDVRVLRHGDLLLGGRVLRSIAFLEPVIGRAQAGLAVAVTAFMSIAFMSIAGRLGLGTLVERLDCRRVAAISLVSQAAALFAMTQATNATALTAACAVFGLSIGNITTLPALIIQREFDAKSFGMLIGLATAISQFTYAFGPGLLGVLHDATGSYTASLMACTVLDVIAAAIVVLR